MQSLRARLTLFVSILIAFTAFLLVAAAYSGMKNEVMNGLTLESDQAISGYGTQIHDWMADKARMTVNAGAAVAQAEPTPFLKMMEQAGGFDLVYFSTPDKQTKFSTEQKLPEGYDPTSRPWYTGAVQKDGVNVTEPYQDAASGILVLSFSAPVKEGGSLKAVVASDIQLDKIVKGVLGIKLRAQGYGFLVSKAGKLIVHSDQARVLKPITDIAPELTPNRLAAIASSGELAEVRIGDRDDFLRLAPIEGTDWYLGLTMSRRDVLAPLRQLLLLSLGGAVVLIAIVVPLAGVVLGRLLKDLVRVRDAMREIAQGGGDLTRNIRVHGRGEIADTADAFNRFLGQLRDMFLRVRSEAENLTLGVNELNGTVKQVASDSQQLSDISSSNAATIEEITVSISHIADNAGDVEQLMQTTGQLSHQSGETMQRVASEVGRSADEVQKLSQVLGELERRSQQISGIVNVIKEIADQTNLLALNAAIEAARAGEQGRGFAVVADEVRKLAERTGQATVEIGTMINAMREETNRATVNMGGTVDSVTRGVSMCEEAAGAINDIQRNMQDVVEKMSEIALSTNEQKQATTAMAQSAERMTTRIQASDSAMQGARGTLNDLNALAGQLREMIGGFKL
ncbi:methyl-accepting chemotaxis protein [Chitinivorax sp. PXF-14]|uniref:methyl-accepting chemotaxis protein n=1 Tax=Chitinivorax sp. PXF-14 TaxID=3230488 RepID=UPI003465545E